MPDANERQSGHALLDNLAASTLYDTGLLIGERRSMGFSFYTHTLLAHDGPKNWHLRCRVYSPGYRIEK